MQKLHCLKEFGNDNPQQGKQLTGWLLVTCKDKENKKEKSEDSKTSRIGQEESAKKHGNI